MELNFPKPETLSAPDFFSGGTIPATPTPQVLDVLSKYKTDVEPEPVDDQEDEFDDDADNSVPAPKKPVTEKVNSVLDKYKADTPTPTKSETTPNPVRGKKVEEVEDEEEDYKQPKVKATKEPTTTEDEYQVDSTNSNDPSQASDYGDGAMDLAEVANMFQEKGLIVEIPEGFPVHDLNKDNFWELIDFNFNKKAQEEHITGYQKAREDIAASLLPEVLEMVNFQIENPNVTMDEVKLHIEHIMYQRDVSQLDPADPIEAEAIIREYLTLSREYKKEEIEDIVAEAKEFNRLETRANTYKPKLEARIRQQIQERDNQRKEATQAEAAAHEAFLGKLDGMLKKGEVNGVKLGNEEKQKLWSIFSQNRIPVPIPGGKTVETNYMNYLVTRNMYAKDGNVENLLLAALVLDGGKEALQRYLAAPAIKKEVTLFKSQAASGVFRSSPTQKQEEKAVTNTPAFFQRQLR